MILRELLFVSAIALATSVVDGSNIKGPYTTENKKFKVKRMDNTDQDVDVWFPVSYYADGAPVGDQKFPFVSYAHGRTVGGDKTEYIHGGLLQAMSEFGYVIAAHESCSLGCAGGATSENKTLENDPTGFGKYFEEQLEVIDWAKEQAEKEFSMVNFAMGIGIAGHSMGGQATIFTSSSSEHVKSRNIKAAVMHHAYTHSYPAPVVPFLAFTATGDYIATPDMTSAMYYAEGANPNRGFVNKMDSEHLEVITDSSLYQDLAAYSAAWFKLFLDETPHDKPQADGVNYMEMIYGEGENSLCSGGYGDMAQCSVCKATTGDSPMAKCRTRCDVCKDAAPGGSMALLAQAGRTSARKGDGDLHRDVSKYHSDEHRDIMVIKADGSLAGHAADDISEADSPDIIVSGKGRPLRTGAMLEVAEVETAHSEIGREAVAQKMEGAKQHLLHTSILILLILASLECICITRMRKSAFGTQLEAHGPKDPEAAARSEQAAADVEH